MNDRFFRDKRIETNNIDIESTVVRIDAQSFRQPGVISIKDIANSINLQFSEDAIKYKNLSIVEFNSQESEPLIQPNPDSFIQKTYMAIDDNYLYVWIPNLNKWKRILLSDWS